MIQSDCDQSDFCPGTSIAVLLRSASWRLSNLYGPICMNMHCQKDSTGQVSVLKILGASRVIWSKVHSEDLWVLLYKINVASHLNDMMSCVSFTLTLWILYLQADKLTRAMIAAHQAELVALQTSLVSSVPVGQGADCLLELNSAEVANIITYKLRWAFIIAVILYSDYVIM